MKYVSLLSVLLLASCVSFGIKERGNGKMVSETFKIGEFDKVNIAGSYNVELIESEENKLEVEIDENLLEFFEASVSGKTLELRNSERIFSEKGIRIQIFYKNLNELNISGACSLNSEEIFKGDELKIDMGGAGIIDLEVDIKELKLFISGAGAVKLAGNVDRQQIGMSGAGGYEASDLVSKFCEINISGVGNADIYVLETLQATISGLGGINYKGKPEVIESDVSGLGVIQSIE